MEEKKKGNGGLIVLVVILLLACVGMGAFIFINKDKIFSSDSTIVKNEKKGTNDKTTKCTDISYDLNTNEYGLGNRAGGVSVLVDKTRKNATISYNAATVSNTFSLGWFSGADTSIYESIDTKKFDKKITQVLIDGPGQDASNLSVLYLMEDGTVEYTEFLNLIGDCTSEGKIKDLKNIVKLQNVVRVYEDKEDSDSIVAIDQNNYIYDIGSILGY